ncbi:MAG: sarcosine oxidase subunit gamma [Paracoccaceae bacterium]
MARLIANSPTEGLLPLTIGQAALTDATPKRITTIAAYPGQAAALGKALATAGLGWPAPNRSVMAEKGGLFWSGRDQAFLTDLAPPAGLDRHAALTEASDGWIALSLSGPDMVAVLARLVPLDLSLAAFPVGATARSALQHMSVLFVRPAEEVMQIYLFRSMTAFAVHEIAQAMTSVAARRAL